MSERALRLTHLTGEQREWFLRVLPRTLLTAGRDERFLELMTNFSYVLAKCDAGLVTEIEEDYTQGISLLTAEHQRILAPWKDFISANAHVLRRREEGWPARKILLQRAMEHADESPITKSAEDWLAQGNCDWSWLRRATRPPGTPPPLCVRTIEGHQGPIFDALVLPDGRLCSCGADKTIRIWNPENGQLLATLRSDARGIRLIEGSYIVSWSDREVRVWDLRTKTCKRALSFLDARRGVLLLPSGEILTSSAKASAISTWGWATKVPFVGILEGHTQPVNGMVLLPDGSVLSYSEDGTLRRWDMEKRHCVEVLRGHRGSVNHALLLSDGHLLSCGEDGTLRIWEGQTARTIKTARLDASPIRAALELPGRRLIVWYKSGGDLQTWDLTTGKRLHRVKAHSDDIAGVTLLPDGRLVSWADDHLLWVWDATLEHRLLRLEGHAGPVGGACLLPDQGLASYAADGQLRLWDLRQAIPPAEESPESSYRHPNHDGPVGGLEICPDNVALSWSRTCKRIYLWDVHTGCFLGSLLAHSFGVVDGVRVLEVGNVLSWSGDERRLWERDSLVCLAIYRKRTKPSSWWSRLSIAVGLDRDDRDAPAWIDQMAHVQIEPVLEAGGVRVQASGTTVLLFLHEGNEPVAVWHTDVPVSALRIAPDGTPIAGLQNGEVVVLRFYRGGRTAEDDGPVALSRFPRFEKPGLHDRIIVFNRLAGGFNLAFGMLEVGLGLALVRGHPIVAALLLFLGLLPIVHGLWRLTVPHIIADEQGIVIRGELPGLGTRFSWSEISSATSVIAPWFPVLVFINMANWLFVWLYMDDYADMDEWHRESAPPLTLGMTIRGGSRSARIYPQFRWSKEAIGLLRLIQRKIPDKCTWLAESRRL